MNTFVFLLVGVLHNSYGDTVIVSRHETRMECEAAKSLVIRNFNNRQVISELKSSRLTCDQVQVK
jgi:hypothetical protein